MITEKREYDVGKTFINSVAVLRSARCVMNLVSAAVNHFTPSTPIWKGSLPPPLPPPPPSPPPATPPPLIIVSERSAIFQAFYALHHISLSCRGAPKANSLYSNLVLVPHICLSFFQCYSIHPPHYHIFSPLQTLHYPPPSWLYSCTAMHHIAFNIRCNFLITSPKFMKLETELEFTNTI